MREGFYHRVIVTLWVTFVNCVDVLVWGNRDSTYLFTEETFVTYWDAGSGLHAYIQHSNSWPVARCLSPFLCDL